MLQILCNSGIPLRFSDPVALFSSTSRPQAEPEESAQSTAREAGQPSSGWRRKGMEGRLDVTSY